MVKRELKEETSFEELLKASYERPSQRVRPGERVSGIVAKVGKEAVFIDLGGKSEGIADIGEFIDGKGNLTIKPGDRVEMRVASVKDGIYLTRGMRIQGADTLELLREAKENLLPVEGRVSGVVKGGFEIDLSGVRAFCPLSQIDLIFTEKPEVHLGARYPFRIMEIKEKGRNIIVSRRVILEEEQEKLAKATLERLKPDLECDGRVTKLTSFGAFVDLGGVEGMVHISEVAHGRIEHPSEVLQVGQAVRVKVLRVEPDREGRPKISLSIKALEPDAWEKGLGFEEGEIIRGKVARLTDFGVFVEVAPGVDGLVHISEIRYERVAHPKQVLKVGEEVEVLVLGVDPETRRISLSIKEAELRRRMERAGGSEKVRLEPGQVLKGIVEEIKPYGLFIRLPQIGAKVKGLLPLEELRSTEKGEVKKRFPRGTETDVVVLSVEEDGKIRLSQKALEEREDRAVFDRYMKETEQGGSLGTLGDLLKDLRWRLKGDREDS